MMMVKVKFEKGAIGAIHQHIHTQVSYVESGVFEITIDGEKRIIKQGDGFFVAPNLWHGAIALEAGILIDVFNPQRADFLNQKSKICYVILQYYSLVYLYCIQVRLTLNLLVYRAK